MKGRTYLRNRTFDVGKGAAPSLRLKNMAKQILVVLVVLFLVALGALIGGPWSDKWVMH